MVSEVVNFNSAFQNHNEKRQLGNQNHFRREKKRNMSKKNSHNTISINHNKILRPIYVERAHCGMVQ